MQTPNIEMFPDGRMTPENAAKYTGLAVSTLAMYRCRHDGPKFVKRGRRVTYYKKHLDEWLEAGIVSSTAQARIKGV